jgi:hypothetical protein
VKCVVRVVVEICHGDDETGIAGEGVGGYEEDSEWDTSDEGTDEAGDDSNRIKTPASFRFPAPRRKILPLNVFEN